MNKKSISITLCLLGVAGVAICVWFCPQPLLRDDSNPEQSSDSALHSSAMTKDSVAPTDEDTAPQEEEGDRSAFVRMPAGYQTDQLVLRQSATKEKMDADMAEHAVDIITGESSASTEERFAAVKELYGARLANEQSKRLLDYLGSEDRYTGMIHNEMHSFINGIVAVFHDQPELSDLYLETSFNVIRNPNEDEVIRDYVLQGLSRGIDHASEGQAKRIREAFWRNLEETQNSLAGTAALALQREGKKQKLSAAESKRLIQFVDAVLSNETVGERTRIPAIQIAARTGKQDYSDDFIEILESPGSTVSEKVAALSGLSRVGGDEAADALFTASQSNEVLLARTAISLIERKRF